MPARLVSATGTSGVADVDGSRVPVCTVLVPDAVEGDWVLVHAGFAIQRLTAADAGETATLLSQLDSAARTLRRRLP